MGVRYSTSRKMLQLLIAMAVMASLSAILIPRIEDYFREMGLSSSLVELDELRQVLDQHHPLPQLKLPAGDHGALPQQVQQWVDQQPRQASGAQPSGKTIVNSPLQLLQQGDPYMALQEPEPPRDPGGWTYELEIQEPEGSGNETGPSNLRYEDL